MATMETLPPEILSLILLFLPPSERLNCALVCRRWAEVIADSSLLRNTRLNIAAFEMGVAAPLLIQSRRQYSDLLLEKAKLTGFNERFWTQMGETLQQLELNLSTWTSPVFYSVLRKCQRLKTLKLVTSPSNTQGFELPDGFDAVEIRQCLGRVRNLYLEMTLSREIFNQLLEVMPSLSDIYLSHCHMTPDIIQHLPIMLTTDRVIAGLDFRLYSDRLSNTVMLGLLEICAESLRELRLDTRFLRRATYAVIGKCTQLRKLTLVSGIAAARTSHLGKILAKNPHLEILELEEFASPMGENLAKVFSLRNLRELSLQGCENITKNFLSQLGNISTLRSLNLLFLNVDSEVLRSLARLKDLEAFFMDSDRMDPECLEIICENFKKLKVLDLGRVGRLTDPDVNNLSHLKDLKSLEFDEAIGFTDEAFRKGLGPSSMESLLITDSCMTDEGLDGIAVHHGRLKKLHLTMCHYITDAGLTKLLGREVLLKDLSVESCSSLTGDWLSALRFLCPRLRKLRVRDCHTALMVAVQFGRLRPDVEVD